MQLYVVPHLLVAWIYLVGFIALNVLSESLRLLLSARGMFNKCNMEEKGTYGKQHNVHGCKPQKIALFFIQQQNMKSVKFVVEFNPGDASLSSLTAASKAPTKAVPPIKTL